MHQPRPSKQSSLLLGIAALVGSLTLMVNVAQGQEPLRVRTALELGITTEPGHRYVLEKSTDKIGWSVEESFTGTGATEYRLLSMRQNDRVNYRLRDILSSTEDYLVIDLSGGAWAETYPVSYLSSVPEGGWTDEYKKDKLVLCRILAGTYSMGSPAGEQGRKSAEIEHEVTLTQDFYMGVFEVTQRQWELVMGNRPSYFNNSSYYDTRPVEQVSYYDLRENAASNSDDPAVDWPANRAVNATSFMGKLRAKTGLTTLDLPTEAQWEYACRAGTATALNSGVNLTSSYSDPEMAKVGRYPYNSGYSDSGNSSSSDTSKGTAKVGSYQPNDWGLYDLHGNVWEWCLDWYGYSSSPAEDPSGVVSGTDRVRRGGSWRDYAESCRSACRGFNSPSARTSHCGFRLARILPPHGSKIVLSGYLSFGWVEVHQTATRTFTITNAGSSELSVMGIAYPVGFSGNWSGGTIFPGSTQVVTVTFAPTAAQSYGGNITVESDATSGTNTLAVNGMGVAGGQTTNYLVIDLSGGVDATTYPVSYLDNVPANGWTGEYKTTKLVLRRIPAGTFTIGSPDSEVGRSLYETQQQVTLTHDFYLGVFEVTQRQWELVMGNRPSYFNNSSYYATRPVEKMSYYYIREDAASNYDDPAVNWPANSTVNATSFMGKLRDKTGLTTLDLPTEAQWEYACRAGTETALNSGVNLTKTDNDPEMAKVGRYYYNGGRSYQQSGDSRNGSAVVGSYQPNGWGLYDMHGNVWEWCLDWYGYYYSSSPAVDPTGAASGSDRVNRGGGWRDNARSCRSASRYLESPSEYSNEDGGFRLAGTLPNSGSLIVLTGDLSFVWVEIPQTATRTFTITNAGSLELMVTGIEYPVGFSGNWSGGTILPGGHQPVAVTFAPTAAQSYGGNITVESDATSGTNTLAVNGMGVAGGQTTNYLVIDLSGGVDATTYPVSYIDNVPASGWTDEYKTTKLVLRSIPAGTFIMGSPEDELGRSSNEGPQHEVTLTQDFYMGVFEVTQRQWELVMGNRPSNFNNSYYYAKRPVEMVSYYDIRENPNNSDDPAVNWPANIAVTPTSFMGRLLNKTGLTFFDLPTEAQWEYACRAGTETALNSGVNLISYNDRDPEMAKVGRYWYNGGSDGIGVSGDPSSGTDEVGSYQPNAWGLYDMHGNVLELCLDWYGNFSSSPAEDPTGPSSGSGWVGRGGSWMYRAGECRSASRVCSGGRNIVLGFRLAKNLPTHGSWIDLSGDLAFVWVEVHQTATRTFTITNAGSSELMVTGIEYPVGFSGNWSGGTILPGGHQAVAVTFAPTAAQSYGGYITVESDATRGTNTLAVNGAGVAGVEAGDYLVIDLSGGVDATTYPVSYPDEIPAGGWTEEYKTNKLVLRRIPAGTFIMGSPEDELGRDSNEGPLQELTLTQDFYMGVFEVTQRQWELVMGNKPSCFNNATYYATRPVETVSYYEIRENPNNSNDPVADWPANSEVNATSFMGKLRDKTGLTKLDLPTEAQWEYACRAGTETALNSGVNLTSTGSDPEMAKVGRYLYNGGSPFQQNGDPTNGSAVVGSYQPNAWGLYDLHGNVWEWCLDWYGNYSSSPAEDPTGASSGSLRVFRGGGWLYVAGYCRSANRLNTAPDYRINDVGFRLALRSVP